MAGIPRPGGVKPEPSGIPKPPTTSGIPRPAPASIPIEESIGGMPFDELFKYYILKSGASPRLVEEDIEGASNWGISRGPALASLAKKNGIDLSKCPPPEPAKTQIVSHTQKTTFISLSDLLPVDQLKKKTLDELYDIKASCQEKSEAYWRMNDFVQMKKALLEVDHINAIKDLGGEIRLMKILFDNDVVPVLKNFNDATLEMRGLKVAIEQLTEVMRGAEVSRK